MPSNSSKLLTLVFCDGLKLKENINVDGQWHIEHCPPNSTIQCFALHKITMFKCKARINLCKSVSENPAPYYSGFWVQYHNGSLENHKHWFCLDDLSYCVNGTLQKFVVVIHVVLIVWPIQEALLGKCGVVH